ncbi:MAG: hypothetical protein HY529_02220 [Chloroflexi bacterium]|nr:hypothetical protein [Chloroflexota bacterium]
MNLAEFLSSGLSLVGAFDLKIVVFLFLLCLIGEAAGLFVPYLLETTWLLAGYQFSQRVLSLPDLVLLMLMAQAGRQAGALALYHVGRSGRGLLKKYARHFKLKDINDIPSSKLVLNKINSLSPFSVTLGRLLWLRIPLTLILGAQRKLKVLLLGVSLSSLIYDGTYIVMGAIVGRTTAVEPVRLIPYFLVGLTLIYGLTFAIRRLVGGLTKRRGLEASRLSAKANPHQDTIM